MKLKFGSKNVDVKIGDKRVNAFLGDNSTKEPITVSINITLGGPEGAPGWIGIMYTTGELPKTKAEMRSLYNYSGSGSNYTVNRDDLTPIPLNKPRRTQSHITRLQILHFLKTQVSLHM